jgi:integrative and conjugative element protein (TIGR02256 family)
MLTYASPGSEELVVFGDEVLAIFQRYRQVGTGREAGGQLFAAFNGKTMSIESATEPNRWDRRGRFSFMPSRIRERMDIRRMHKRNLHYVGDWHTHPERLPRPSSQDLRSIAECFEKSIKDIGTFLLVVVGTDPFPEGLYVGLHDGIQFRPIPAS